jgi:hypothetical protein
MKNILIIQEAGRHEENKNFRECLSMQRALIKNGAKAEVWGLGHPYYDTEPDWEAYDLIINLENYDTIGWVPNLHHVRTKKFLWSIDAHVKGIDPYMRTANDGQYDLILQATPEFCIGTTSAWFPNCYDDTLIEPYYWGHEEKKYDVGFCGNINNRGPLLAQMQGRDWTFKIDEMVIGKAMVEAINSYGISWNANIGIDINYRNFETMGCGVPLMTSFNAHYIALGMKHGEHCFMYSNTEDMLAQLDALTSNPVLCRKVANKGLELVASSHTYSNRAQLILGKFL